MATWRHRLTVSLIISSVPLSYTLSPKDTVRFAPTLIIVFCVGGIVCELAVLALQENLLRGVGLAACEEMKRRPSPDFSEKCDVCLFISQSLITDMQKDEVLTNQIISS